MPLPAGLETILCHYRPASVLPRTVARKYPSHSRDPFLDGEAILALIHKRRIVVDRQIERPRVPDEEWR
jgi:hypothetical protein